MFSVSGTCGSPLHQVHTQIPPAASGPAVAARRGAVASCRQRSRRICCMSGTPGSSNGAEEHGRRLAVATQLVHASTRCVATSVAIICYCYASDVSALEHVCRHPATKTATLSANCLKNAAWKTHTAPPRPLCGRQPLSGSPMPPRTGLTITHAVATPRGGRVLGARG